MWFIYSIVMHGICVYLPNVVADNWIHYTLLAIVWRMYHDAAAAAADVCDDSIDSYIVLHCLVIVSLNRLGWAECVWVCLWFHLKPYRRRHHESHVHLMNSESPCQVTVDCWWLCHAPRHVVPRWTKKPSATRLITNRKHFNKSVQPLGSRRESEFSPSDRSMRQVVINKTENIMFT